MNKLAIGAAVAAALVIALIVVLVWTPALRKSAAMPAEINASTSAPSGVYNYAVYFSSISGNTTTAITYVQFSNASLIELSQNGAEIFQLFSPSRIGELYRSSNTTARVIIYPTLVGYCANFTIAEVIASVQAAVANTACSSQPFSSPANFIAVASALAQAPGPSSLKMVSTASTPLGVAGVYKNTTTMSAVFYQLNFTYIAYILSNGIVYKYSIIVGSTQGTLANITYLLKSTSPINETYTTILADLSKPLPITNMGGLSLVQAAEKLGMVVSEGSPTLLAFIDLNDTSSARLFAYNSSLFYGHGLILLDSPSQPQSLGGRLRCLYNSLANKTDILTYLRQIYTGLLNNSTNPYSALPNSTCSANYSSESALLGLALAGANLSPSSVYPPVVAVVYPNGTYTVIYGYNPQMLKLALGG